MNEWVGQLTLASATVVLLYFGGRAFIRSLDRRVKEVTDQYERTLQMLKESWEARIGDLQLRAEGWETAFNRREEAHRETLAAVTRVETAITTNTNLVRALRGKPNADDVA